MVNLSNEINSSGHNITQPFFTKINGRNILFFCSDNKKGYGQLDIWYAEILDDLSVANINNAGPYVNSIENDITPFYHQPSNRLYFSSTWHNGYGGYDVFFSHWNDSIFEIPKNAGKPINSSWNDLYFWINDYGKHGYVTTNRDGSMYDSIPNCCPDIWEFTAKKPIVEKEIFLSHFVFIGQEARYVVQALKGVFEIYKPQKAGRGNLLAEVGNIIEWAYIVQSGGVIKLEAEAEKVAHDPLMSFGLNVLLLSVKKSITSG